MAISRATPTVFHVSKLSPFRNPQTPSQRLSFQYKGSFIVPLSLAPTNSPTSALARTTVSASLKGVSKDEPDDVMFIQSFICSFNPSFVRSIIRTFVQSCVRSIACSFNRSFDPLFDSSIVCLFVCFLNDSFNGSFLKTAVSPEMAPAIAPSSSSRTCRKSVLGLAFVVTVEELLPVFPSTLVQR